MLSQDSTTLLPLLQLLSQIKPLKEEIRQMLIRHFWERKVEKNTVLLHEGDVCENLWFMANGLARSYHEIGDRDFTSRIMYTNHIVISPGSFFMQKPAVESIETLTDCTLGVISFSSLQEIYAAFPEFNYHTRIITEDYFYKQEQRLYMLRQPDAVSRYKFFLEHYSDFLKDIPQHYIASFLGMTRETLSRTRNKIRNL